MFTTMKVQRLYEDVQLPEYQTNGAAGMDLRAYFSEEERAQGRVLHRGDRTVISTGLRLIIPEGLEGQVRTRSGLSVKEGIIVVNAPGTIDSDYRGELRVGLFNVSRRSRKITHGMRIAQLVISPYAKALWDETDWPEEETERGEGAFGSTGLE